MERVRKSLKGRSWRKVITYFLTCCLFLNTSLPVALATPTPVGGGFTVGTGTITQAGNATNVVVDQLQSVIEWSSLDTVGGVVPADRESLNSDQFCRAEQNFRRHNAFWRRSKCSGHAHLHG